MTNLKDERKSTSFNPTIKAILSRIVSGQRLRLREGAYRYIKEREWIFNRVEGNKVYLLHDSRAYGIVVEIDDIDWSVFNPRFIGRDEKTSQKFLILQKGG